MEYVDYHQDRRDNDARAVLLSLRLELATRESNEHVGSGLGGNPTDFLFLLSNPVQAVGLQEGAAPYFSRIGANEITLHTPKNPGMKRVREALSRFLEENFPNRPLVKQEQLSNPSYVKHCIPPTLEVNLLVSALEHVHELVKWLDAKREMEEQLNGLMDKECVALEACFLREQGLPETYFEDTKKQKGNPVRRMFNKHPVWGTKERAVRSRYHEMKKQLLSPEDNQKLEMVGAYPQYIALFAFRSVIGIERTVALNLDENPHCSFLGEINKEVNDVKESK